MIDELIKNLRHDSVSALQNCDFDFVHGWMLQAADAIEELQKQLHKSEADNINLTGWLAEEHAKHLWIPVTERLPEESGHYLIYVVGGEFKQWSMVTMAYYHKKFYYDDMEDNFDQITHWIPLPQPPEREE